MDFSITPEQEAFVDTARRFGEQRLAPFYKQREREGAFDRATLAEMGELGFFGVELPEEHGGLGADCLTAGLVLEALCASDYNIGQLSVTMSLAGTILARHGDAEVVRPWLERHDRGRGDPGDRADRARRRVGRRQPDRARAARG